MRILAVDPGTERSGYVVYDPEMAAPLVTHGAADNLDVLNEFAKPYRLAGFDHVAVEMVASYGMPVGRTVFETCVWIGQFVQAWGGRDRVELVYRQDVKLHLCGTPRAKDANIWQALVDRFGAPGTKKAPGPLYGVRSHARAALALAVTVADRLERAA